MTLCPHRPFDLIDIAESITLYRYFILDYIVVYKPNSSLYSLKLEADADLNTNSHYEFV